MTTLTTLRKKLCIELGSWNEFTTTSAGAADGTTMVSTDLKRYRDNQLNTKWVKLTSGATQVTREVEAFQQAYGTLHPYTAFGAQVATAVTFELHDFNPSNWTYYINNSMLDAFPKIGKDVVGSDLITKNAIPNSFFIDWTSSSYPDYWRTSVSTVSKETTIVLFGPQSMKVANAGYAYLSSAQHSGLLNLVGQTPIFYCYAYGTVATTVRLAIAYVDGGVTTVTYGDYHTGGSTWEKLSATVAIPSTATEVQLRCCITGANTGYFSNSYCEDSDAYDIIVPATYRILTNVIETNDWDEFSTDTWNNVEYTTYITNGVMHLVIKSPTGSGRKLQLFGTGGITELSADTDTVTLDSEQGIAVVFGAAYFFYNALASTMSAQGRKSADELAAKYYKLYKEKLVDFGNAQIYRIPTWGQT